jgi:hypothetical protein
VTDDRKGVQIHSSTTTSSQFLQRSNRTAGDRSDGLSSNSQSGDVLVSDKVLPEGNDFRWWCRSRPRMPSACSEVQPECRRCPT